MEQVIELAGWCAAEGFLNLSQDLHARLSAGEPVLLPFLVIMKENDTKRATTIFAEVTPQTFQDIALLLDQLSPSDKYAVLVQDAFVTIDGKKSDCLIVEGHRLVQPRQSFSITIAYELPRDGFQLRLRRPILGSHSGFDVESVDFDNSLARGRDSHDKGAAVWRAHFRP